MLSIKYIRQNKVRILESLKTRNSDIDLEYLDELLELDNKRKLTQNELHGLMANKNKLSKPDITKKEKEQVILIKQKIAVSKSNLEMLNSAIQDILLDIPNIVHHSVPQGSGEQYNEVYKDYKDDLFDINRHFKCHWELGKMYDIIDFELGGNISGSGFPVFKGKGAKLQRALINFFLDEAEKEGYDEYTLPLLVNESSVMGTGQLPDKEDQMYYVGQDDMYLIPTAEVPLTNVYRDRILDRHELPVKLVSYTPCFRREAGSYGSNVRGLNRVHQFDKVEIVRLENPDHSYKVLYSMIDYIESLLIKLELPYRILRLCGGDLGFTSALTFDFEVYSSAQKKWLEVSSVSNFETFQSNRMKIRFRDGKDTRLVHTLNGSALALPRIIAALLEFNQTENSIEIPQVLHKYLNFKCIK